MRKIWQDRAWDEYVSWQTVDKKLLKRINQLLADIERNGNQGIGNPEPLKGNFSGYWSRHIDGFNRLIYRIAEDTIEIISCKGHYDK